MWLAPKLIPLDELNQKLLRQKNLYGDAWHAQTVYTDLSVWFARSQQAAEDLIDAGYHNVALLEGGIQAWKNASLPIKRCGSAISLERQVQIAIGMLAGAESAVRFHCT